MRESIRNLVERNTKTVEVDSVKDKIKHCIVKINSLQSQLSHVLTLAQDKDFDAVIKDLKEIK